MSSADIPDDPTDRRDDPIETRFERFVDDAVEVERASGSYEETEEQAKRHILVRVAIVAAGIFVTLLGIVLLAAPGPGLLVVALGLTLLATEVPFAARLLDKVKERLPQDADGKLPKSTIAMMVGVCVVTLGASFWWYVLRPD